MVKLEDRIEKNSSKVLITSIIIFVIICICVGYIKDRNSVNVYTIKSVADNDDVVFKNLQLVHIGNSLYVEKGCTINIKEGSNFEKVRDINIKWYIDNKEVYSSSVEKIEGGTAEFINSPIIVRKVRMNSDSTLIMKITYSKDGEEKESMGNIKLKDYLGDCVIYN